MMLARIYRSKGGSVIDRVTGKEDAVEISIGHKMKCV